MTVGGNNISLSIRLPSSQSLNRKDALTVLRLSYLKMHEFPSLPFHYDDFERATTLHLAMLNSDSHPFQRKVKKKNREIEDTQN